MAPHTHAQTNITVLKKTTKTAYFFVYQNLFFSCLPSDLVFILSSADPVTWYDTVESHQRSLTTPSSQMALIIQKTPGFNRIMYDFVCGLWDLTSLLQQIQSLPFLIIVHEKADFSGFSWYFYTKWRQCIKMVALLATVDAFYYIL